MISCLFVFSLCGSYIQQNVLSQDGVYDTHKACLAAPTAGAENAIKTPLPVIAVDQLPRNPGFSVLIVTEFTLR